MPFRALSSPLRVIRRILLGAEVLGGAGLAEGFPPAPYYTLYGVVRDQVGQTVTAEGAEVILLKGGVEVGRTPITSSRSYEPNLRIDQGILKHYALIFMRYSMIRLSC